MPTYIDSSSSAGNNVTSLVVPFPVAPSGSAVLLFVGHSDGITYPDLAAAGFVEYAGSPVLAGTERGHAYFKFMDVGDVGASLTIGPLSVSAKISAGMLAYSDVDATNPTHAFAPLAEAVQTLIHTVPTVRTTLDGCVVIHACIAKDGTDGVTVGPIPSAGMTMRVTDFSGGSAAQWLAVAGRGGGGAGVTPGDYGGTITSDAAGVGQRHAVKWSIALAPPSLADKFGSLALDGSGQLVMAAASASPSGINWLDSGGVWQPIGLKRLIAAAGFSGSKAFSGSGTLGMSGVASGPAGSKALSGAGSLVMKGFVIKTIAGLEHVGATSTTVVFPTGTAVGDMLLVRGSVANLTLPTNPAGWAQVHSLSTTANTQSPSAYMTYRFLDSTDVAAGQVVISHPSNVSLWDALAVTGVNTTTPLDVAYEAIDVASASTATFTGLTTTGTGRLLVYVVALNSTLGVASAGAGPGTFTQTAKLVSSTRSASMGHLVWPGSGATGAVTVAMGGTGRHVGILAAFRPA